MDTGYIKLYRKIEDNPVVCKDNDYFRVWHYLLYNATHKEREVIFGSEKIILKPGELITGEQQIANKCNISRSKVTRILKTFKIEQQIEQQTCSKGSLISLKNWQLYQKSEQQIEQQVNNERTTSEQQVNTNNNVIMKEYISVYNNAHAREEENFCHLGSLFKSASCVECMKKNNCPNPESPDFKLTHPNETFEDFDKRHAEELKEGFQKIYGNEQTRGDPNDAQLFNCNWLGRMNEYKE